LGRCNFTLKTAAFGTATATFEPEKRNYLAPQPQPLGTREAEALKRMLVIYARDVKNEMLCNLCPAFN
jgi:hypothetical protein